MSIEKRINKVLDKIRPYLLDDGEDSIVYVHLGGACSNCHLIDYTLKDGVQTLLIEEIPEVKEVINI